MLKVRPTSEAEVIAEFLRNELYRPEFDDIRATTSAWLATPDIASPEDNRIRRELLFRRRRNLWNELPPDLLWWEVALDPTELAAILMFPRGHWRKIAGANRTLPAVVHRLQNGNVPRSELRHLQRLRAIGAGIRSGENRGAIVLIGTDEHHPCTVIEGNHRVVAAALEGGEWLQALRYYAGFSTSVAQCVWHAPNAVNFMRYSLRRLGRGWQWS